MKKALIYKISNTKTVDIYIGSTIQTLKLRFKAHRSNAKLNKNGKLYDCMRKNGIECLSDLKDIKELAVRFSIKNDVTVSKGESGFKPITYFKEIGSVLNQMKIGEIYGPMKVAEGYSIFKLIDVREDSSLNTESFDEIKKELVNELRHLKMKNSMNQFIAKLAKQKNITVNKELINTIPVTTHNSVVFRLLGFGGKITAVPLIAPNSEWVDEWLNSLKVIP